SPEIDGASLSRLAWAPDGPRLTRSMVPVGRSKTKTSTALLVSPATRLVAALAKATLRPSADSDGAEPAASPGAPPGGRTSTVVPAPRSRTNTSTTSLVSPGARLWAAERNATTLPSPLIDGL